MIKPIFVSLAMCVSILLSACGANSSHISTANNSGIASDNLSTPMNSGVISGNTQSQADLTVSGELTFHKNSMGSNNELGFYSIETRPDGVSSLIYTDFSSRQRVVLCNRPECTHSDNTCNAFVGNIICLPVPIAQKDKLILLYPGWPSQGGNQGVPGRVEVRDLNGENAKNIVTFGAEVEVLLDCVSDDNNLYVIANTVSLQEVGVLTQKQLWQINLQTGELQIVSNFSTQRTENLMLIGAFDQTLLLKRISVGAQYKDFFDNGAQGGMDEWNAMIGSQRHEIFSLNLQGNETPLISWGQFEAKGEVLNDICMICDADGSIRKIDLRTGQDTSLAKLPNPITLDTAQFLTKIENTVVMDVGPENYMPGKTDITRYAIQIDNGMYRELSQTITYDGITSPIPIITNSTKDLLVISEIHTAQQDEPRYNAQSGRTYTYCLITAEDFLSNVANYTELSEP